MNKILKETTSINQKHLDNGIQQYQTKKKASNKGDDFIFKRYRYEENNILNNGISNSNKGYTKNIYLDDYNKESNKQNDLNKYKEQLQLEENHFDIIDFQQDEQCDGRQENESKIQYCQNSSFKKQGFLTASNEQKQIIQQQNQEKPQKYEIDIKPMELFDFQQQSQDNQSNISEENEQVDHCYQSERQNDKKQIKQHTILYANSKQLPKTKNYFRQTQQNSSFCISSVSPSNSFLYSPNQTFQNNNLQQSSSNFVRKPNKLQFNTDDVPFISPQNIGLQKYQIKKITQNDNPFQDAVDYSNQNENQLKGIKIHSVPFEEDVSIQIIDKELFVSSKIPPGIILKCKLKRSKGFLSLMSPQFDLYLQNGLKHLISAKKNSFRNRELFQLSTQVGNYNTPIRSLMANILHNTYWLVDQPKSIQRKKISYLDLLIQYKPLDQKLKKQRQMIALCPPTLKTFHIGVEYDIPYIDFDWFKKHISLQIHNRHKGSSVIQKNSQKNFALIDSDQEEDDTQQIDVEKSKNKSTQNSIFAPKKGQQIKDSANNAYYYIKMEKQSQNIFDVEIQHPLTPLQAMAIILTRFDAQLK